METNGCRWGAYCECHETPRNAWFCCKVPRLPRRTFEGWRFLWDAPRPELVMPAENGQPALALNTVRPEVIHVLMTWRFGGPF